MRLVRKVSRRRYYHRAVYEYERLLLPIPRSALEVARPWANKDLWIYVEPLDMGFAVLACTENRRAQGIPLSLRFGYLVQQLAGAPKA